MPELTTELAAVLSHYVEHDRLPTVHQLAVALSPTTMISRIHDAPRGREAGRPTAGETRAEKYYAQLQEKGLVTEPGPFSGRHHLTERGFKFFEQLKRKEETHERPNEIAGSCRKC